MDNLLIYFGIAGYAIILITFLTGIKVIKAKHIVHKTTAIIGVIVASVHAIAMFYFNYLQ